MSKRIQTSILILAFILAACAPPLEEFDWCYIYNFAISDYDINIQAGEWIEGVGIRSVDGEIIVNWQEDFFVESSRISVVIERPDDVSGNINIAAIAVAFGVEISNSGTIPSDIDEIQPYGEDTNPLESTNTVSATIQVDQAIVISSLIVSGYGVTPFDENPCGAPTNTPPPSNTPPPTNTVAPTSTPTNTLTPTPTGTPPACFRLDYDFTISKYNESINGHVWTSGIGFYGYEYHPNNLQWLRALHILFGTSQYSAISVSRIEVDVDEYTSGAEGETNFKIGYRAAVSSNAVINLVSIPGQTGTIIWSNPSSPLAIKAVDIDVIMGNDITDPPVVDPGGSILITGMRIFGSGNPDSNWTGDKTIIPCWDVTPTPTFTASPNFTATPTPTGTPTRTPLPVTPSVSLTPTRTHIVVSSPQPTFTRTPTTAPTLTFPPPPTNTPGPSPTPSETKTLIAPPTGEGGTPVATYPVPGFGTLPPSPVFATLVGTMPPDFTPILTSVPFPSYRSDVYNYVATAASNINQLPDSINGQIPQVDQNISIFGAYIKGLSSGVSLQEILGQKLYVIGVHVFYSLAIIISMSFIYSLIYVIVQVVKFVLWVIDWLAKIIGMLR